MKIHEIQCKYMSWHHLAMCRPPPTLPRLQIIVKSMKINENTCPGINWQCASLPHPPEPSNPPEINGNQRKSIKIRVLASIGNVQAFPTLYISRNHQAPSQIACMMETSMQKKRSAAEAQPINIYIQRERETKHDDAYSCVMTVLDCPAFVCCVCQCMRKRSCTLSENSAIIRQPMCGLVFACSADGAMVPEHKKYFV